MKPTYYIRDTKTGRFYGGHTHYIPWIDNAFTDCLEFAVAYTKAKDAKEAVKKFYKTKYESDGNTPLKRGRLEVVKLQFVRVR